MTIFGIQGGTSLLFSLVFLCDVRRTAKKFAKGEVPTDGRVTVRVAVNLNDPLTRDLILQGAVTSSFQAIFAMPFIAKSFNGGSFSI